MASVPYFSAIGSGSMPVPFALAHFLAVLIQHQAVDVHGLERYLFAELEREHNHARHPKEQDVPAGLHDRRGVVGLQVLRYLWPAERGESATSPS